MTTKLYLNLALAKGQFYHYSATEEPGYELYESSTGKTHFRKYFDEGIIGVLDSAILDEEARYGREIRLKVYNKEEKTTYFLNVKLEPYGDNIQDYSESLIMVLGNLEKGKTYRFYPYVFEKDETRKYTKKGISVKVFNEETGEYDKVDWAFDYKDVPRWEQTMKKGKNVINKDEADEFLYQKCIEACNKLSPEPAKEAVTAESETTVEKPY